MNKKHGCGRTSSGYGFGHKAWQHFSESMSTLRGVSRSGAVLGAACSRTTFGSDRVLQSFSWLVESCQSHSSSYRAVRIESAEETPRTFAAGRVWRSEDSSGTSGSSHSPGTLCKNHRTDTATFWHIGWSTTCPPTTTAQGVVSAVGGPCASRYRQLRHDHRSGHQRRLRRDGAQWDQPSRWSSGELAGTACDRENNGRKALGALANLWTSSLCEVRQRHYFSRSTSVAGQLWPCNPSVPATRSHACVRPSSRARFPGRDRVLQWSVAKSCLAPIRSSPFEGFEDSQRSFPQSHPRPVRPADSVGAGTTSIPRELPTQLQSSVVWYCDLLASHRCHRTNRMLGASLACGSQLAPSVGSYRGRSHHQEDQVLCTSPSRTFRSTVVQDNRLSSDKPSFLWLKSTDRICHIFFTWVYYECCHLALEQSVCIDIQIRMLGGIAGGMQIPLEGRSSTRMH